MNKMEKNHEWNNNWNSNETGNIKPRGEEQDRAFLEFQKAVESRLGNDILERIESFRKEISKIKKAKR